jgi:Domain of unknown function (DUF6434)/SAP domain-containing new25
MNMSLNTKNNTTHLPKHKTPSKRAQIATIKHSEQLKKWYWLNEELVDYCKQVKLSYTGSKFEILERISNWLDGTPTETMIQPNANKPRGSFDWQHEVLYLNTIITNDYKNTKNVREFFMQHCGKKFRFTIPFMTFMKTNLGKTLGDAVSEWKRMEIKRKDPNFKSIIPEGNQYNQYLRDFFEDNPQKTVAEARHFWKLKRSLPVERHFYEKSDLKLK